MNWIFDTYSNIYKTAMMQEQIREYHAANANTHANAKRQGLFGLFVSR